MWRTKVRPEHNGVGDRVGPVLMTGTHADAILRALRAANPQLEIVERGSYVRVLVPRCCVLSRADVERELGRPFRLPDDLAQVMTSFRGRLVLTDDEVSWRAAALEMPNEGD